MGRETLKAREHEIFQAVRRWVEENVEDTESDVVVELVLSCVRLESLPLDKLLGEVRKSELVSDSAILDAVNARTEKGLVSDFRAYLMDYCLTTRVEDLTKEPKIPKDGDIIRFKASYSIVCSSSACSTVFPPLRDARASSRCSSLFDVAGAQDWACLCSPSASVRLRQTRSQCQSRKED